MSHIALIGKMHSGKTTTAQGLTSLGYIRIGLADEVKNTAVAMVNASLNRYGLIGDHHFDLATLESNKSVFRPLLQWLGTDLFREFFGRPTFWIDQFLSKAKTVGDLDGQVVCDDVRFLNEATTLREHGFLIVRIVREDIARQSSILASGGSLNTIFHASETEQDAIHEDVTIYVPESADRLAQVPQLCDFVANHDTLYRSENFDITTFAVDETCDPWEWVTNVGRAKIAVDDPKVFA